MYLVACRDYADDVVFVMHFGADSIVFPKFVECHFAVESRTSKTYHQASLVFLCDVAVIHMIPRNASRPRVFVDFACEIFASGYDLLVM